MPSAETDLVLLQRFKETGDATAFSEIVRRYAGAVFATCHRILRDPTSAEDAAQETFFRLMTRPQRVSTSLGGWLHRAATRLALDIRRSDTARRRRELAYEVPAADEMPSVEASSWAEVAPKLDEALAALPEEQRELLVRHFLRGEPQAQLATEEQTSAATMCRRIKAAVDALRQELVGRGVSVSPAVLLILLGQSGASHAPAALTLALGKMSLFCSARSTGLVAGFRPLSPLKLARRLPTAIWGARWAIAALLLSLVVALLIGLAVQRAMAPASGAAKPLPDAEIASPIAQRATGDFAILRFGTDVR